MNRIIIVAATVLLAACTPSATNEKETTDSLPPAMDPVAMPEKKIRRFGMVTGIKPEKIDYYKHLHANGWPGVQKMISECNIRNYSIYLKKIDAKHYLFSYFEYTGSDFEADMKKMAADTTTQRWWRETDPTQIPLPEAAAKNKIWTEMEEVFHQD